jgi:glyoxylase-like metal-dependent hydrolase (beta-lactamase superfamily II)
MTHPDYEVRRSVLPFAAVVLAANPGPMTLDGTNTWLLGRPGGPNVVVDPGPAGEAHLAAVVDEAGEIPLILLTHRHEDHCGGAVRLRELTGAPVRASDPALCRTGAPLTDGERIELAGIRITVLATPGHTSDSVCLLVESEEGGRPAVLTGDTILGRGTTIIAHPDGRLGDYLASLRLLQSTGPLPMLPGHGPELPDLAAVAGAYLAHREERLQQVRAALATSATPLTADEVVARVYADVDRSLWPAALASVRAQLAYLRPERPADPVS